MIEKLCTTCVFADMPATTTVCSTCTRGGVPDAPHWKMSPSTRTSADESKDEKTGHSDGSTADYYELPAGATQLQDLISHLDMNAQLGEIFRACYRYGRVSHSPRARDLRKIIFYAEAELKRLEKGALK